MAAAKTKSKKPAAKTVRTTKASRAVAGGGAKSVTAVKKTPAKAKVSQTEVKSQTVHLLAFIFTCLCLIFLAMAYYAYS